MNELLKPGGLRVSEIIAEYKDENGDEITILGEEKIISRPYEVKEAEQHYCEKSEKLIGEEENDGENASGTTDKTDK